MEPVVTQTKEESNPITSVPLSIFESAKEAIVITDPDGLILFVNSAFFRFYGVSKKDVIGKSISIVLPEAAREFAIIKYKDAFRSYPDIVQVEAEAIRADGKLTRVDSRIGFITQGDRRVAMISYVSPLIPDAPDAVGEAEQLIGVVKDKLTANSMLVESVSKLNEAKDALKKNFEMFHLALKNSKVMFFSQDIELRYTWVFHPNLGDSEEKIIGKGEYDIFPKETAYRITRLKEKVIRTGKPFRGEVILPYRGEDTYFDLTVEPLRLPDGTVKGITTAAIDITDQKQIQKELEAMIGEKEVMLREIHHRVKNNLAIIQSLFEFSKMRLSEEENGASLLPIFEDCQNRIRSMALIHENLYSARSLGSISLREYIEQLTENVKSSILFDQDKIEVICNLQEVPLDIDRTIHLGMAFNELLTNCFRHAFPKRSGRIQISLTSNRKEAELKIEDDGQGFNPDRKKRTSLGLNLVEAMAKKISGTLESSGTPGEGSVFRIVFPLEKPELF
ncbi:PAS domain S-box protein [Leptospira broomii serovar Hurstbridge str. 5399]|uniref:histidine kinase n=1 Tax=Leptospira broomii serovar Hurstbridge str. 5399 TaxID=1049789 RepID=T0F8F2_9LEPT|nr:PAS domain S-box protein [Leptospira broomii]EQA44191.1 PAS domain S-box protein [Leptospira broomii serovar Hurstbridge str. 5399]